MIDPKPPIDGPAFRATLIARGLLVPAQVVAGRPLTSPWVDEPPTCRLLGNDEELAKRRRLAADRRAHEFILAMGGGD